MLYYSLLNYIDYWFIDIDELIDFLSSIENQQVTVIISDIFTNLAFEILRKIFPQIIRIISFGIKCKCSYKDIIQFPDAKSLLNYFIYTLRDRQRLYITFDSWPIERTSQNLNEHTIKFAWFSFFYNILSRLNHTNIARDEFL